MKQNKLLNLLGALTPKEFKELEHYAKSPFFIKKKQDIPLFYKVLKGHYPFQNMETVDKELLFEGVYGKEAPYVDKKFRQLQTDFVKIIENYLLFLENEAAKLEKEKRLVAIYGKRNIYEEFEKGTNKLLKTLDNAPYRDAKFYYDKYLLESSFYFHPNTENRIEIQRLIKSLKCFESYFVLERAKLGIDLKNRENIFKEKHIFNIEDYSHIIPTKNYVYQLYDNSFKLLKTSEEAHFLKLKKLYHENINNIKDNDKFIFFTILQNFIIKELRTNEYKYLPILFKLFQLGLEQKILLTNGKINGIILVNIISTGLQNGKIEWAKSIIEAYKKEIIEEKEGFIYTVSTALIAFYEEKYSDVLKMLNLSFFSEALNHYGFKTLLIRASFMLLYPKSTYHKIFLKNCQSFEKYLTRDIVIITEKTEKYLNFTKFIRKVGQKIYDGKWTQKMKAEKLLELKQNENINYKKWLEKTISEIN